MTSTTSARRRSTRRTRSGSPRGRRAARPALSDSVPLPPLPPLREEMLKFAADKTRSDWQAVLADPKAAEAM